MIIIQSYVYMPHLKTHPYLFRRQRCIVHTRNARLTNQIHHENGGLSVAMVVGYCLKVGDYNPHGCSGTLFFHQTHMISLLQMGKNAGVSRNMSLVIQPGNGKPIFKSQKCIHNMFHDLPSEICKHLPSLPEDGQSPFNVCHDSCKHDPPVLSSFDTILT